MIMQAPHQTHQKLFLTPAEVAHELAVSTSTVLRLIHAGELPAIAVSQRIYRIPVASFELFKAGALWHPEPVPLGPTKRRPRLASDERLPDAAGEARPLATR